MPHQDKCYVLCVEYEVDGGGNIVGRSKPTTRKAANKKRREYVALEKGVRCWVEKAKEKPFALTNPLAKR